MGVAKVRELMKPYEDSFDTVGKRVTQFFPSQVLQSVLYHGSREIVSWGSIERLLFIYLRWIAFGGDRGFKVAKQFLQEVQKQPYQSSQMEMLLAIALQKDPLGVKQMTASGFIDKHASSLVVQPVSSSPPSPPLRSASSYHVSNISSPWYQVHKSQPIYFPPSPLFLPFDTYASTPSMVTRESIRTHAEGIHDPREGAKQMEALFQQLGERRWNAKEEEMGLKEVEQYGMVVWGVYKWQGWEERVIHSPKVVAKIFSYQFGLGEDEEVLLTLLSFPFNLSLLEMINGLISYRPLPDWFHNQFIHLAIDSCDLLQDPLLKKRTVRLVCLFIHNLISTHGYVLNEILEVVQSFCMRFAQLREAAGLYRVLKTIENAQNNPE